MLSAGPNAQSQRRVAASGPRRPCIQSLSIRNRRCKLPECRRAAHLQGRAAAAVAAAAAPDPRAGDSRQSSSSSSSEPTTAREPASLGSSSASVSSLLVRTVVQVLALAAALACLILLPAYVSGRLAEQPLRAAASYCLYLLFFASGTIMRMLRYGRLAEARRDAQRSSGGGRLALLLFAAVLVPAGHWAAWWDPSLACLDAAAPAAAPIASRLLNLAGYSLMLAGWALNAAAAAALGKVCRPLTELVDRRPACPAVLPASAVLHRAAFPACLTCARRPTTGWWRLSSSSPVDHSRWCSTPSTQATCCCLPAMRSGGSAGWGARRQGSCGG